MRLPRLLAPVAGLAALAFPPAPAQAVNTLAYTFTVDCRTGYATTGSLGVTLPSGRYLVTVAGACSFSAGGTGSVPVDTCVHPLEGLPCAQTGISVNNVPREACIVGLGIAYEQVCQDRGVWLPYCDWWFTVKVNDQCLTTVPHTVGVINHNGGAMTARVLDGSTLYYDNVGTFTVTAVWTPA